MSQCAPTTIRKKKATKNFAHPFTHKCILDDKLCSYPNLHIKFVLSRKNRPFLLPWHEEINQTVVRGIMENAPQQKNTSGSLLELSVASI
jgi:hypothetical protein